MKQENSANEYEIIIDLLGNKTKPPEAYDSHLSDGEEKSFFQDVCVPSQTHSKTFKRTNQFMMSI